MNSDRVRESPLRDRRGPAAVDHPSVLEIEHWGGVGVVWGWVGGRDFFEWSSAPLLSLEDVASFFSDSHGT